MKNQDQLIPFQLVPVAILSIYVSGALKRFPFSAIAITDVAPGKLFAAKFVPSKGSTAISKYGPFLFPSFHQYKALELHLSEPSPITTSPFMSILFNS